MLKRKNEIGNRNTYQNTKTGYFKCKNRKPDLQTIRTVESVESTKEIKVSTEKPFATGDHGSCIHHLGLDICFDKYNYHDSLQACLTGEIA